MEKSFVETLESIEKKYNVPFQGIHRNLQRHTTSVQFIIKVFRQRVWFSI